MSTIILAHCACPQMNLGSAVSAIKHHYEKYLYPYERFLARDNKICTPTSTPKSTPTTTPTKRRDVEVSPGKTLRYTVGAHSMVATATTGGRDSPHSSSSPVGSKKLRHAKSAGKEVRPFLLYVDGWLRVDTLHICTVLVRLFPLYVWCYAHEGCTCVPP